VIAEGWHRQFGGPHAEIEALHSAGAAARGATMYVTLEPCCHFGKTPPCTDAVLAAGIAKVVVAQSDPFPAVAGGGIRRLQQAGVAITTGVLAEQASRLNAPYRKLITRGRPWVLAKWAMTLDGKLATRCGDSRWISNASSRAVVHRLRGRMDGILVGRGTALRDDPLLTARPPGPRQALRIVLDSRATLRDDCQLVRTARDVPVLVAVGPEAPPDETRRLEASGCEVWTARGDTPTQRLQDVLDELGRRRLTNVLVEGGGRLLGTFLDAREIDEVHVFIAAKLVGGEQAVSPIAGTGFPTIAAALNLERPCSECLEGDAYIHGRVAPTSTVPERG
jgi:diaminohydroxyphosphoribosylaminopyrimidine deaminase/5-amino-6-(5-phosphoribosylamino)uracil reductase